MTDGGEAACGPRVAAAAAAAELQATFQSGQM